jgi:hypothetical protein
MGVIVGNWLGKPRTIAGKDSKQPIIHFWACGYLVPFATFGGFSGFRVETVVRVQWNFTTGTDTTVGNAAPLHLLLGFVLMQINCQCPPKQYQETTGLFSSSHLVYLPLNKKHKITCQHE